MSCDTEPGLWPIRLRPLLSEVFTGWIARLAQGHGVEPGLFFAHLRSRFRLAPNRDLDTDPSYELLAEVSRRTAIRYERLVGMTLRWHVHPWYASEARNNHTGDFGFCSLCWGADPVPYIRRAWRLPWMACEEHRAPLFWRCPSCKRLTSLERLGAMPPLPRCAACGFDIRGASPASWPRSIPPQQIADLLDKRREQFADAEARYLIAKAPCPNT